MKVQGELGSVKNSSSKRNFERETWNYPLKPLSVLIDIPLDSC